MVAQRLRQQKPSFCLYPAGSYGDGFIARKGASLFETEAMKKSDLQRKAEIHRAYSNVLQAHLVRLWGRNLSEEERNTVQSATLCCSYMGLESSERRLSHAMSSEQATEEFGFLKSEVHRRSEAVAAEITRRLRGGRAATQRAAFPNLLAWEEALLAQVPS